MQPPGPGLLAAARTALDLIQADPAAARDQAAQVLTEATRTDQPIPASVAERALGLASAHLLDGDAALRHLRRAVELGAGSAVASEARMTLAGVLAQQGETRQAMVEIEVAVEGLHGIRRARALVQRGAIRHQLGDLPAALGDYTEAWPELRSSTDLVWRQRLLMNRGLLLAFQHRYHAAARDLGRADEVCAERGLSLPRAHIAENLALVHRRLGDVPASLTALDRAERLYRQLKMPVGSLMVERGELLMSIRLVTEAQRAAELAVAEFSRTRRGLGRSEARLLLARTILFSDPDRAGVQARRAVRELTAQDRPGWASLARYTALMSRLLSTTRRSPSVTELVAIADELAAAGWGTTTDDARLIAGRRGLGTRHAALARAQLELLSERRHRGPAERRVRGWLATALLAADDGRPGRAAAAASAGLHTIEEHRATMVATDLRARISMLGTDLARIGLRHAVEQRRPWAVLQWAERGRARHLVERPATPPADPDLARLLTELRTVISARTQQQRQTAAGGEALERRQVRLEETIRDRVRLLQPDRANASTVVRLERAALLSGLGEAALLEFVIIDDRLLVVCVADGRATLHDLGAAAPVTDLVEWVPFALRRLARSGLRTASAASARELVSRCTDQLDARLLAPVRDRIADRRLVVVPTGALQSLPWALLPGARGRPVTVTPTASLWLTASARPVRPGPVVAAAGPGLPGADREATAVAALWGVSAVRGPAATAAALAERLDGSGLAHLAAHGTVRSDNPQFSALTFADGPLTVYDIEQLRRAPDTVVLAACEAGRSVVLAGDELLGLASAFLAQDTRHLIASTVPLPDVETEPMMVALHRRLADGEPVADALAAVQAEVAGAADRVWAAAAGFICLGAGFSPAATGPAQGVVTAGTSSAGIGSPVGGGPSVPGALPNVSATASPSSLSTLRQ